ncbi:tyrosine-type recombinase/integrase [Streptomyces sp. NPDC088246]|uniref:tyrosine-type recombinase/integrase n=1 Tax=Streptomyces sp. NPDC088246 TaxID=3365842 RepID=UPI0037FA2AB9
MSRPPRALPLAQRRFRESPAHPSGARRGNLHGVHRAIAALGFADPPPEPVHGVMPGLEGVPEPWAAVVERWHDTSTLTPKVRGMFRSVMAKAGRWLAAEHPDVVEPTQWTCETCAAWVAALDRMTVGEYVQCQAGIDKCGGEPLSPRTKAGYLTATRTFFRDCQEWEWIPRRFDPVRAPATPRSVAALIGPNPRVIADDIWAKLLRAGLNIDSEDFPTNTYGLCYPIELIRAVTLARLFSGPRSDETARLRMGVHPLAARRFPHPRGLRRGAGAGRRLLAGRPTHKTGSKAGVPTADVRGYITSHRARSTIASQLYNAKVPMTLFELQAWLGHRSPEATQHYAEITPNALARAYSDAGYFERNVRTIEVLVDRDAVTSGTAASGEPWQYYDLGHGFCTYSFFEQCPHRMACARCDFCTPESSGKGRLLGANDNLQRMLAIDPLSDEERAAVDAGQAALDQLLERLVDVPTPGGATPREIGVPATATLLPIAAVNQGNG